MHAVCKREVGDKLSWAVIRKNGDVIVGLKRSKKKVAKKKKGQSNNSWGWMYGGCERRKTIGDVMQSCHVHLFFSMAHLLPPTSFQSKKRVAVLLWMDTKTCYAVPSHLLFKCSRMHPSVEAIVGPHAPIASCSPYEEYLVRNVLALSLINCITFIEMSKADKLKKHASALCKKKKTITSSTIALACL